MVILAAADTDVGKLQEKLVPCIVKLSTHLVEEKLKEDGWGKWSSCRCGCCPRPTGQRV